ncbi:glycosyltransferase family 2 protein [Bacillus sp. ISL-55]|uniref:glycosyltransferase family 2 protein n=1 Tax=Bacillus sp. ISL-55 TaxID=2819134 RepID=UPI001BE4F333|nr:glycosyltransferase family 2 protein [Bacillus sp. ISL-55]MBT2692662.1 glycosyltransferase family 2 protein [Bacillus sp. ISL-55]
MDTHKISVIIPVYNEEKYISEVIESINQQSREGQIEIIVVDGNSTDRTRDIILRLAKNLKANREIRLLTNPEKSIPRSLNIACEAASAPIIVRIDGHTKAPKNYISEAVKTLESIDFNGITGGRLRISPGSDTTVSNAISTAVCHPFGIGNASYRTYQGNEIVETDTVPFGAFAKETWELLGGYDEELLGDEDYDFCIRARAKGMQILLNPSIILDYYARPTYIDLWEQYYRYGYWTTRTLSKHKKVPAFRKCIPLLFTATLLFLSVFNPTLLFLQLIIYLAVAVFFSFKASRPVKEPKILFSLCLLLSFPILHFSYGFGNIFGIAGLIFKRRR